MSPKVKFQKIKLLLLDVDGVLTDGSVILGPATLELKIFNIHDGLGIKLAQASGLKVGIISSRSSEAVTRRAEELGIQILYQGQQNKLEAYDQIKRQLQLTDDQIAYIGDDLPDLKLLTKVGFSCTVTDSCEEIKKSVDYVTRSPGGKGAVREVIELILKQQQKWTEVIRSYDGNSR